jgi:hypothetical protein
MITLSLDNEEKVRKKLSMLQALTDMKITKKILDAADNSSDINFVDQNYQKLKCKIDAVEKNSDEWNTI